MPDSPQRQDSGSRAAAISNAVVQITSEYTGRGPTKASTTIADNLVVVVMAETLVKGERRLVEKGEGETVLALRKRSQLAMRTDLVAAVEGHTGRKVAAVMSDNHIDPDIAVEVFLLAPAE